MINLFRRLFLEPEFQATRIAQTMLESQRANIEAAVRFHERRLDGVRRMDPSAATEAELVSALECCQFYWGHAYPETENDLVEWVESRCAEEMDRRRKALGADC